MPPAPRRQRVLPPNPHDYSMNAASDSEPSEPQGSPVPSALMEDVDADVQATLAEDEEDDGALDDAPSPGLPPLPLNLREISSLASWTVSSSKPGCSVPQLRSNDTQQFWQSDGPQPHLLNIHFFKQVSIVGVRLFLDFESDESYTPTHIQFLAGTGYNDLQQWADMKFDQPKGWIDVDFSGVGRDEPLSYSEDSDREVSDDGDYPSSSPTSSPDSALSSFSSSRKNRRRRCRHRSRKYIPVLRAYLVQIKILENHQNGKDTHLRGVQIFARDKSRREEEIAQPLPPEEGRVALISGSPGKLKSKKSFMVPEWATIPEFR